MNQFINVLEIKTGRGDINFNEKQWNCTLSGPDLLQNAIYFMQYFESLFLFLYAMYPFLIFYSALQQNWQPSCENFPGYYYKAKVSATQLSGAQSARSFCLSASGAHLRSFCALLCAFFCAQNHTIFFKLMKEKSIFHYIFSKYFFDSHSIFYFNGDLWQWTKKMKKKMHFLFFKTTRKNLEMSVKMSRAHS